MVGSLVMLSETVSFRSLAEQSQDFPRENSGGFNNVSADRSNSTLTLNSTPDISSKEPSFGGKLMSFAGRAFGGGPTQASSVSTASFRRSTSDAGESWTAKKYSHDLREAACLQMAAMKISTPRSVLRRLPLPLLLLTAVAEANSYRFSIVEEAVAIHLCEIVAKSPTSELQSFAMEILIYFMPFSLSKSKTSQNVGIGPISAPIKKVSPAKTELLKIMPIQDIDKFESHEPLIQSDSTQGELKLLTRLCQTIQSTNRPDTAEVGTFMYVLSVTF